MNETNKQIAQLSEREQTRYRYKISRLNEELQQQLDALVVHGNRIQQPEQHI